jgi:hypothetical protein
MKAIRGRISELHTGQLVLVWALALFVAIASQMYMADWDRSWNANLSSASELVTDGLRQAAILPPGQVREAVVQNNGYALEAWKQTLAERNRRRAIVQSVTAGITWLMVPAVLLFISWMWFGERKARSR